MTHATAGSLPRLERLASPVKGAFLLLTDPLDIRWVTGFTGSTSRLLVNCEEGCGWLIVDARYEERAWDEAGGDGSKVEVVVHRSPETADDAIARIVGGAAILVDPAAITVASHSGLSARTDVHLGASNIGELRRVKDPGELAAMRRAAEIADAALLGVVADGLEGRTEREIRGRLDEQMRRGGADDVAFPTIVAAGPNASRPHHEPGERLVEAGDCVIIDMGAMVNGYRSDMTRTIAVGDVGLEMRGMLDLVLRAQADAISALGAGVPGREVDFAARSRFARNSLGHEFVHGTGHGVGLAIHEKPILGPSCDATLLDGEVVTVEPGLYRRGFGGVRIEDLLVVSGASSRSLTSSPKDLSCPQSPRMI